MAEAEAAAAGRPAAVQEAAEENWAVVNDELSEAIDVLRAELAERGD